MIIEGFLYRYAQGMDEEHLQRFAIEVDNEKVTDAQLVGDVSDEETNDFSTLTGESIEDPFTDDIILPDTEQPKGDAPQNVPAAVLAPASSAAPKEEAKTDTKSTVPPQAPKGRIHKYTGVYQLPVKGIPGIEYLKIDVRALNEQTLVYDTTAIYKNGKEQLIDQDREDHDWNKDEFVVPTTYRYYIWKKAHQHLEQLFGSTAVTTADKLPSVVVTSHESAGMQIRVVSRIQDTMVDTRYDIIDPDSRSTSDFIVHNKRIISQSIKQIEQTFGEPLKTKADVEHYNRILYEQYVQPNLSKLLPKFSLVYEGMDGLQLRKAWAAKVGNQYRLRLISYNMVDGRWIKDPESIAEQAYPTAEQVHHVLKYLDNPSKTGPGNTKNKFLNKMFQKLNDKIPTTNWYQNQKRKKDEAKLVKQMQKGQEESVNREKNKPTPYEDIPLSEEYPTT